MPAFSNLTIEGLFPTPMCMCDIESDPTLTVDLVNGLDWDTTRGIRACGYNFLKDFPILEGNILSAFNAFVGELGYSQIKFSINTSWLTLTPPGEIGNNHRHYNSMWTGVYYPFEGDYSPLEINKLGLEPQSFLLPRDKDSRLTTTVVYCKPQKDMLIFFPSHILHKITENETEENRYSLAFTLHPCGNLDTGTESSTYLFSKPLEDSSN